MAGSPQRLLVRCMTFFVILCLPIEITTFPTCSAFSFISPLTTILHAEPSPPPPSSPSPSPPPPSSPPNPFPLDHLEFSSVFRDLDALHEAEEKRRLKSAPSRRRGASSASQTSSPDPKPSDESWLSILEALKEYKAKHGHLIIPRGHKLAKVCYTFPFWSAYLRDYPSRVDTLRSLSFVFSRLQPEWNVLVETLSVYLGLHGHVDVPPGYSVPLHDEAYGPASWGLNLGSTVSAIRSRGLYITNRPERILQLNNLGFIWDKAEHNFTLLLRACRAYKEVLGEGNRALRVPQKFKIPSNSPYWPSDLGGYPLGLKLTQVRQKSLYIKSNPRRLEQLIDLGVVHGNADLSWLSVIHASAIYSFLHDKTLDPPVGYKCVGPEYPSYIQGLPLGERLKDVRLRGRYLGKEGQGKKRREQLDALGFVWVKKRGRPSKSKSK